MRKVKCQKEQKIGDDKTKKTHREHSKIQINWPYFIRDKFFQDISVHPRFAGRSNSIISTPGSAAQLGTALKKVLAGCNPPGVGCPLAEEIPGSPCSQTAVHEKHNIFNLEHPTSASFLPTPESTGRGRSSRRLVYSQKGRVGNISHPRPQIARVRLLFQGVKEALWTDDDARGEPFHLINVQNRTAKLKAKLGNAGCKSEL